ANTARAEPGERKFVVLLAAPIKSMPRPLPIMPNPDDIFRHYFDTADPTINSFAEYWQEISYGNVHVSGDVFGWVEVPWPVMPKAPGPLDIDPAAQTQQTMLQQFLPYADLNNNGEFNKFGGEEFDETQQMFFIDYNGEMMGTGTEQD